MGVWCFLPHIRPIFQIVSNSMEFFKDHVHKNHIPDFAFPNYFPWRRNHPCIILYLNLIRLRMKSVIPQLFSQCKQKDASV